MPTPSPGSQLRVFTQDAATGSIASVLAALDEAAAAPYWGIDASVAYVTKLGAHKFISLLQSEGFEVSNKRWLVSIDYGISEPAGLDLLDGLNSSGVRIPNGPDVLQDELLRPRTTFHAKAYAFRSTANVSGISALVVGSANLTLSALTTGGEVVALWRPTGRSAPPPDGFAEWSEWFESVWEASAEWSALRGRYVAARDRLTSTLPTGEEAQTSRVYAGAASNISSEYVAALATARTLWFETGTLYANRGPGVPGNQLDTPRGTRVFFGFSAEGVPRNTVLGQVDMQVVGHERVSRSIRFGDNQMDKVNLPIPGTDGPPTYDESILAFDRVTTANSRDYFRVSILTDADLSVRRQRGAGSVDYRMGQGGRRYGVVY